MESCLFCVELIGCGYETIIRTLEKAINTTLFLKFNYVVQ